MHKRLLTTAAGALLALAAMAQATSVYDVEGTIGTYSEITGGTVVAGLPAADALNEKVLDGAGNAISGSATFEGLPIGFGFKYDNKLMDRFAIGTNGYLLLGKGEISVDNSAQNSYNLMDDDGISDAIGVLSRGKAYNMDGTEISYRLDGTAPNRTLTVQFKDLGMDIGMWDTHCIPVQLQIRLHESGAIDMALSGWAPNYEDMPSYYAMKVGIKGRGSDRLYLSGSYTDFSLTTRPDASLTWNNDTYPADGQTYTFTPPADCEKPTAQPTALQLASFSTRIEGSFAKTKAADHYLTLVAEGGALSQLPEDGMEYAPGDAIGNATVVAYDTLATFATADNLDGTKQYTVYVFAANSYCMFGPKYLTDAPLTATATTLAAAPASLTAEATDVDALKVAAEANATADRVLIAMTTEPAYDNYQQITGIGAFGTPVGNLAAGSEIEGGGKVVYVGEASDDITIGEAEENTTYYFMAWSIGADGSYSTTSATAATATGGTVPYSPDFSKMQQTVAPTGWQASEDGFTLAVTRDEQSYLTARVTQANPAEGVEKSVVTPWVRLSDGSNRVLIDMNITRYENRTNAPYNNWEPGDTLMVQASADGSEFTTIGGIGPNTTPQLAGSDSYATLRMAFDGLSGQKVKFRIVWKTYTNPTINLKNFTVEHKDDCDYPINLRTVSGSVVGDKATIDWDRQGNENEWELRYKPTGTDEWGETVSVLDKPFTLAGLPGTTDIDVQLRAKCDAATASRWSDTFTFRTGYTVPFTERFDGDAMPSGWEPRHATLATPTEFTEALRYGWQFSSSFFNKGLTFSPVDMSTKEWLLMPAFDLEDGSANYVLNVYLTILQTNGATADTYSILLSKGGEAFNEADVIKTVTGAELAQSQDGTYTISVPLRAIEGIVRPALYISTDNEVPAMLKIDSVSVTPTCPVRVSGIAVSDVTETAATVTWQTDAESSYIFVRRAGETAKPYVQTAEKTMTFTGLEPRTDYEVGLTTVCEPGDTAKVALARFTTLAAAACPQPADVEAVTAKYSFTLSWSGEAQGYNVRYRKAGDDAWTVRQTAETTFEAAQLAYGTEYEYAVQAVCSTLEGDTSAYTPTATVKTLDETCFPPTAIAVEPSYDRATVTWEGSYESYTVAYAEAASEEWTEATAKGNSYTIEGLKPETAYRLRLRSFNSETDFSQWSEEKAFTTTALPECVTPTDLAVAMPTATTATLSWTAGERNLSWTVNWRKSDASAWTAIEGLTATSCELTGLTEGAAYIWRVMAECELNESRWSSQNRFTAIPTAIGSTDITGVTAFVKDGTLNIVNPERGLIRSVRIYNAAGQLVAASSLETTDNVFMPLPACDGNVLIIKIDGEGCQRTIKTAI